MKYIFLLNRFSLKKKLNPLVKRIEEASKKLKLDYKIEINSREESTEDIVERYKKKSCILLAVGGDGTINRVLNGIVGTKNILGFIPYGTGNDLYRSCQELLKEKENKIDLVKINDKYFINVACFGIDAEIGNNDDMIHSKWIPESQRYNMSLVAHFLKYKTKKVKVTYNNKEWINDMTTIVICNGRYYGGGYKVGYTAKLNNGSVDLYLIDKMNKLRMATLITGMNKGKHENSKHTTKAKIKEARIEFEEEVEANIDGEQLKSKTFDIKVIPKGITLYYDQELIDEINKVK
ncbi:MAG: YegS/Rv2252/BmrU family lipid kinase [Bacilli bacterium]|nr:YegS/Rv2252/BmrU family lipid kinase [Bacilli bacterium]MBR6137769.1 YegS/Rv2252/BmrU family lipid kinase [Bacilli bacterium]